MRGDWSVEDDWREDSYPRSARGRACHPDDRMDDAAALPRIDPRRRRYRSPVQEPDAAPLDGASAAREARYVDRGGARGRQKRAADRQGDRRILRDWRLPRRRPEAA